MRLDRFLPGATLALLALASGCGGGGAGNAGAVSVMPDPVIPPPVSASGLVPQAGTVGATLYADAAALRVVREGAVWTYRGVDQPRGAATAPYEIKTYTNTVTHVLAGGGISEAGSNPLNEGPDTSGPLRFEGGAYNYMVQSALPVGGPSQAFTVTELRSPVRVNDQYVSLDKHLADGGSDLDGDKVNDALDMAVYARVIGEEMLDLPNRRQVKAVRVDMIVRARATYSKTGTASPLYESTQSNWYATGLGIVKTRTEEPNAIDPSIPNRIVTEVLQNWDGLTEGLGDTGWVPGIAPPSSPLAGVALQYALGVVGFDTHAVVVTMIPGQPPAAGIALSQLGPRGNVLAARAYTRAELFPAAQYFREPLLLRIGSELRLLARTDFGVSMVAFDSTGQRILRPAASIMSDPQFGIGVDDISYRVATNGADIWLGWVRLIPTANSVYLRSLAVQHFDAEGQPLGAARAVLDPVEADVGKFSMALSDTRLAVSWRQSGLPPPWRLVMIDASSGVLLADKTLGSAYEPCTHVNTLALQPGIAMICWDNFSVPIGAARLDAGGEPVLSAGATLRTDALKAPWLTTLYGGATFTGIGGQLTVAAIQQARYWPEDNLESGFTSVFQTSGVSGPMAASEPTLLARIVNTSAHVLFMAQVGNRVLLIGSDGAGKLNSMAVWLPK